MSQWLQMYCLPSLFHCLKRFLANLNNTLNCFSKCRLLLLFQTWKENVKFIFFFKKQQSSLKFETLRQLPKGNY